MQQLELTGGTHKTAGLIALFDLGHPVDDDWGHLVNRCIFKFLMEGMGLTTIQRGVLHWVICLQSLQHSQIEWILLQTIASIENGILHRPQLQALSHQLSDSFLKFNL